MDRQMTLAEINDEFGAARTNKKEFLEKMDSIIPWVAFVELVQPYYYKGERGNKPYPLELMLKIFILQNLYDLADMKAMNEVIDSRAFTAFCCINSPDEVPDGDTIGRFRALLTKHNLQEKIFKEVVNQLEKRGLILKKGTIVDSTFIEAPSSTKNRKKERDPEAHSAKKGNTWHFGYKAHIGVDEENGLIHTVKTTAANEHDVTVMNELLHGEEERAFGDSGYIGAKKRPDAVKKNKSGKNIKYIINRRPSSIKKLSKSGQYAAKKIEKKKSSVRCKVEHVFAVVKRLFRYRKTRYRGLKKQTAKNYIMFALANLYLADRKSLSV
jgi:IS5 family transposase